MRYLLEPKIPVTTRGIITSLVGNLNLNLLLPLLVIDFKISRCIFPSVHLFSALGCMGFAGFLVVSKSVT